MEKIQITYNEYYNIVFTTRQFWANSDYPEYINSRGDEIEKPNKTKYEFGDIVYIIEENSIGVVLGCIDNVCGDLRTDMDGMQHFGNLRHATMEDFNKPDIRCCDRLKKHLETKSKVTNQILRFNLEKNKDRELLAFTINQLSSEPEKLIKKIKKGVMRVVIESEQKVMHLFDWHFIKTVKL